MEYSNQQPPEGINTTDEHPLKEFSILVIGAVLLVVLVVGALSLSSEWVARLIPFKYEVSMTSQYVADMDKYPEQEIYLAELADRLSEVMDLPEDMQITVHYSDTEVVNAFATLGGNILMYRGLLEKLPSENAVAMVLAHEIAHIKHRDPLISLGRGVSVSLALGIFGLQGGGDILGKTGLYTMLKFNRDMESAADDEALLALQKLYGHVEGAKVLFKVLMDERHGEGEESDLPQFLLTHPLGDNRIKNIEQFASRHSASKNKLTPLPNYFVRSLLAESD